jgi:predicted PurR-regulated permease PerM
LPTSRGRTITLNFQAGTNVISEARDTLKRTDGALLNGILIVALLYFAREVFVPLALAGLIAFVLAPAAVRLERLGMKRAPAALLVILFSLAAVAVLGWALLGQIYSLAVEFPQYQQNVADKIGSVHLDSAGKLSSTIEMLSGLNRRIRSDGAVPIPVPPVIPVERATSRRHSSPAPGANKSAQDKTAQDKAALDKATQDKATQPVSVRIEQPEESMLALAGRTMTSLLHPLTTTFIVVIFLVFMLIGREDLRDRGLKLAGSGRMHVTTTAIKDATLRVSRYLQMQLVVNLSYGAVAGLALRLIGVPHPLLWAVLTCVLRFVPYVGIMMAAAGPLVLAAAASPHWSELIWTVITFGALEIVAANFVEPMLYGASTGISAIAILIAAVFWTFLWGLPGLLLSTPLTVCLIVIGRQVPRLHYLEVLFGERTGLPPSEHFYQRVLASNTRDARAFVEASLNARPRAEVYDTVIVPALTMIGEARHSEEMTTVRAEEVLQSMEELVEDLTGGEALDARPEPAKCVLCIPARDFADEIACQLAQQVLQDTASVRSIAADSSMSNVQDLVARVQPEVICVVGVPPRAMHPIKMRCHQLRVRFPESVIVACMLSDENELSSLRSRIPTEDAQHVVSSLQLMRDYLTSVLHLDAAAVEGTEEGENAGALTRDMAEEVQEVQRMDPFDGPVEGMFERLAMSLARSLDAPIALITAADGNRYFWEAQCGLPQDASSIKGSERECSICNQLASSDSLQIVADTADDPDYADDPFLKDHGIRFCIAAPLKDHDDKVVGSLCVLDTRPRQITEKQKEMLTSVAESVMMAIEMSEPGAGGLTAEEEVSPT